MSRFNTGNPLGSGDPRDLDDNAKNMDLAMNSDELSWDDRFGRDRKSFEGMEREFDTDQSRRESEFDASQAVRENEFESAQNSREVRFNDFIAASGYQFLGDYGPGLEFTEYNQLVRDENGEFWRLSGQVELPYTTTGAGIPEGDALVPAGDAVLRQDLANPDKGALMVRGAVIYVNTIADLQALDTSGLVDGQVVLVSGTGYKWESSSSSWVAVNAVSIADYGASPSSDATAAINEALGDLDDGGVLIIPIGVFTVTPSVENDYILTIPDKKRITIIGESRTGSVLKVSDSAGNYLGVLGNKNATQIEKLTVSNMTVDHNQQNNGFAAVSDYQAFGRYTVSFYPSNVQTDDFIVDGIDVINCDSVVSIYLPQGDVRAKSVRITNNRWLALDNSLKQDYDQSLINIAGDGILVTGNTFQGNSFGAGSPRTCIETHASNQVVSNNQITKCQVGMNLTGISRPGTDMNIVCVGNNIEVTYDAIMYWAQNFSGYTNVVGLDGILISSNHIRLRPDLAAYGKVASRAIWFFGGSRSNQLKNVKIIGNQVLYPEDPSYYATDGFSHNTMCVGWYLSTTQSLIIENVTVEDNTITNSPSAPLAFEFGSANNLTIKNNTIIRPTITDKASPTIKEYTSLFLSLEIGRKISILNNEFRFDGTTGPSGIYYIRDRSANVGTVELKGNTYDFPSGIPSYFQEYVVSAFATSRHLVVDESFPFSRESVEYPLMTDSSAGRIFCEENDVVYHPRPGNKTEWVAVRYENDITGVPGNTGDIAFRQPPAVGQPISWHHTGAEWRPGPLLD